jgi:hypothetical protein
LIPEPTKTASNAAMAADDISGSHDLGLDASAMRP